MLLTWVFLLLLNPCSSLLIHIISHNSTRLISVETLASFYSTLGARPTAHIDSPISLINQSYVNDAACTFSININGSIVVYTEKTLPPIRGCNNDDAGVTTSFARAVQRMGGVGLVIGASEKFSNGRVIGFSDTISMPVIVAPYENIQYIQANAELILSITLAPVTMEEENVIMQLRTLFPVWAIINAVIFGILIFVIAYTLYLDFLMLRKAEKYFSHLSFLKWMCFASALCSFLWHAVDPFSFNGITWWYSCILKSLMLGFSSIVTLLVLRIWISAPLQNGKYLLMWSIIIYCFVSVLFTTSVAYGVKWDNSFVVEIHLWSHVSSLVLGATGYVYFGRHVVSLLANGGNRAKNSFVLPTKISIFIVFYALVAYSLIIVTFMAPTGIIIGTLLVSLVVAIILVAIVVMLFLPKKKRTHSRPMSVRMRPVSGGSSSLTKDCTSQDTATNSASMEVILPSQEV